ncbi:hypothetical protein M885DRAFT_515107 [Pelagophyceae sp. CCMP2097]|nr:hypothetical protein M885DRAFT_515107 [Pelagophyceae sp. CCMP2097]
MAQAQLVSMGFSAESSAAGLRRCAGDVERALEWITRLTDVCERVARRDEQAANCVLSLLSQLASAPHDAKMRVVLTGGGGALQVALRAADEAGCDLLVLAGYARHDATTLALRAPDAATIDVVRRALEDAVVGSTGAAGRADFAATAAAAAARAAVAASFTNLEPQGAGVATLNLVVDGRRVTRRFDADDTLSKVVRFLATLDETPADWVRDEAGCARTWRVVEAATLPFWWCDAWRISDNTTVRCFLHLPMVTIAGAQGSRDAFASADAPKTLTSLGLWPSATVTVDSVVSARARPAADLPPSYGAATKPRPSDVLRTVGARHDAAPSLGADRREHVAVARSVDKTPGLGELLSMGFSDEKARAALRRTGGLNAAIEFLINHP